MKISRRWFTSALCALAAVGLLPACVTAEDAPKAKPKVLVFTHWMGFRHSSLPVGEQVIAELGQKSGLYDTVGLKGYEQKKDTIDFSMITADYLKQFDLLVFFTQGDPPFTDEQKQLVLDFVRNGKGYVGVHCGADTFYSWPEYGKNLSGGYFNGHGPNHKELTLINEDPSHPAMKGVGPTWVIADEFYTYKPESFSRDNVRVLMSVDSVNSDLAGQKMEKGGDYALAWCKNYEKGRAFYTALGHREDVWTNPKFQEHLLGGIKWALGLEKGDATPTGAKK